MKWILLVCLSVAAVQAVSERENFESELEQLGKRIDNFCMLMKASEGPSYNPEDFRTAKDLSVFKNKAYGAYGMNYNGGVMQLRESARNEVQKAPGFRINRPEGFHTEKSMASLFLQNQLIDLTAAQWEGLLGDRSNQTCDSTSYRPVSQVHKIMKFPGISCNTICRSCFAGSLPICLKNQGEVKSCFCTLDAAKPLENYLFRITDDSSA